MICVNSYFNFSCDARTLRNSRAGNAARELAGNGRLPRSRRPFPEPKGGEVSSQIVGFHYIADRGGLHHSPGTALGARFYLKIRIQAQNMLHLK